MERRRNNHKNVLSKDYSSGRGSISNGQSDESFQNYTFETLSPPTTPNQLRKRVKVDNKSNILESTRIHLENSENHPFHNTLNDLDISNIITTKTKKKSPGSDGEFDAFANFLSTQNQAEDDLFGSFNTQIINQIDLDFEKHESKTLNNSEEDANNSSLELKSPLKMCFSDKFATLKEKMDRKVLPHDISNNKYRIEVDHLFEQIEQSICAMGTDDAKSLSDEILDVFFADDILNPNVDLDENAIQEELNKSLKCKLSPDDVNCSLGSVIRQALIKNAANKNLRVDPDYMLADSITLNRSVETKGYFKKLGDFYGLPDRVKELIKQYKGIDKLYDWQEECLELAIRNRTNLIYALPTSGGKTLVAEILMLREILCYEKNIIFILPYVSIVQEKVWDFSPFGVALDFLVEEYASSKGSYPPKKRRRKRSVYIATIEKSLGLVNSLIENGRLHEIGLIVVDELHLIGEPDRGSILEACLTKVLFTNSDIQIVGMSATIGNIKELSTFLNAEVYTQNFRPVELVDYVKCESNIARINWNYKNETDLLVDVKKLDFKYSEEVSKVDPDMMAGLVLQVIPKGSCLVFCPSKRNCENIVHLLCKLTKPHLKEYQKTEKEQLLFALKGEAGELCHTLKLSVPYGIAYHHSGMLTQFATIINVLQGLTSDERHLLEDAFRNGVISVICCTSTLAAGVNLPAKRVVLRSPYIGRDFISLSKYKQMAGRAGRTGLGEIGESIIVTSIQDLPKVKELLMSPMNQALSSMHLLEASGLMHLLLSCIGLGIANTRVQLQKVTESTLMAVQVDRLEVNIKKLTDFCIKMLFKLGALQDCSDKSSVISQANCSVKMESSVVNLTCPDFDATHLGKKPKRTLVLTNNTKLKVSALGTAAIKGGLDMSRAHQLYNDLYKAQKSLVLLNCLHLLYLVTPYGTADNIRPNITVYYNVLLNLDVKETQTARILGFDEAVITKMAVGQTAKQVPEGVLNRFYVALMLFDLWNEMPVFKVAEKFEINRGIVQNLMTNAASFASNVVNFCDQLEEFWAFSHLLKGMSQRLSHCCIKELVPLMELPAVKQSRARQLFNAGYKNLQSIAKANVNELIENIEFMSRRTANQLIAASKMLLLEKVENLREEAEDVLAGVEVPKRLFNTNSQ